MAVVEIGSEQQYDDVLRNNPKVLAYFRAEWSDVCRAADPLFAEVSNEYAGRIVFIRVDIDDQPAVTKKAGITAIPHFRGFKSASKASEWTGPANKARIQAVAAALASA